LHNFVLFKKSVQQFELIIITVK